MFPRSDIYPRHSLHDHYKRRHRRNLHRSRKSLRKDSHLLNIDNRAHNPQYISHRCCYNKWAGPHHKADHRHTHRGWYKMHRRCLLAHRCINLPQRHNKRFHRCRGKWFLKYICLPNKSPDHYKCCHRCNRRDLHTANGYTCQLHRHNGVLNNCKDCPYAHTALQHTNPHHCKKDHHHNPH